MANCLEIRQATIACLQGRTAAGDRVYPTPLLPWRRELPLPAIGVYLLEERGESLGDAGPFTIRYTGSLVIDVVTETPAAADLEPAARLMIDAAVPVDALCEQIKVALLANHRWYRFNGPPPHPALFEMLERLDVTRVPATVEQSDRRTVAAQITAGLRYTCEYQEEFFDDFLWLDLNVDVIDPACDPNLQCPGPDGRIEMRVAIPKEYATPVAEALPSMIRDVLARNGPVRRDH